MRGLPALLPVLSLALAQTVIPFWHTAGPPGDRVLEEAIRSFNAGQNAYRLEARYVGDYREAGVKLLAATFIGGGVVGGGVVGGGVVGGGVGGGGVVGGGVPPP